MVPNERVRTRPTFAFEAKCRRAGYRVIAGIDEAGRGALAGPVVAAAVVLPDELPIEISEAIDDSKKLTAKQRESVFETIRNVAVSWGVGLESAERVDALGIVPATKSAMRRAIRDCGTRVDFLLIDAVTNIGIATPSKSIIRGDSQSFSIAAASIVAKVSRDRMMADDMESRFPSYGFASHKGYGTAFHLDALSEFGPSPIHRRTFRPVSQMIVGETWAALGSTSAANISKRGSFSLPGGIGSNAEHAAARHLETLGYRIVARNYKTSQGEVDIIAKHAGALVFIEVKARGTSSFGSPVEGMTPSKLRRLKNVAIGYLAAEIGSEDVDWRIDFVGVTRAADGKSLEVEVVQNAHY